MGDGDLGATPAGWPIRCGHASDSYGCSMPDNLDPSSSRRRRNVADFLAILVGMSLIGVALYGGPLIDKGEGRVIRNVDAVWMIQLVTGALAVTAVSLAQSDRWHSFGRGLIAIAGIIHLGGLGYFMSMGWRAWLTVVVPGVLLIALSRFIGPIQASTGRSFQRPSH
jgi:nitrate reductase NapE component